MFHILMEYGLRFQNSPHYFLSPHDTHHLPCQYHGKKKGKKHKLSHLVKFSASMAFMVIEPKQGKACITPHSVLHSSKAYIQSRAFYPNTQTTADSKRRDQTPFGT
jgi:hypothetical protein